MDNILELIVIFFVIYTVLGLLFKKKKPQRPQYEIPTERKGDVRPRKSPPSSTDILDDILGFKIPKTENEYQIPGQETYPRDLESSTWDPEKEFKEKIRKRESEISRTIEKNVPDVDYDKLSSLEKFQKRSIIKQEPIQYGQSKISNKRTLDIRNKLKNPNTVRDLYLISEILNKPKALRK